MAGYSQRRAARIIELWIDIQDVVGLQNLWPNRIRDLFWSRNVKYFDRQVVAAFVFVNGLNPEIFLEWVNLIGMARDRPAIDHFKWLFRQFETDPRKFTLYGYNVTNNRYEYINGKIRLYKHKSERK